MKKNEIIAALEPVVNAFNEFGILYYVSGSVASSAYGIARATLDVDLVSNLTPFHIQSLCKTIFVEIKMMITKKEKEELLTKNLERNLLF